MPAPTKASNRVRAIGTPESAAAVSSVPTVYRATPKSVRRTINHTSATAATINPAFGMMPNRLSVNVLLTKSLTVPPGASRITRDKP